MVELQDTLALADAGEAEAPAWTPPPSFDDYRLVRRLGEGSMGEVYLAHDLVLDRPVAVKFIRADAEGRRERMLIEARAAARIQHPNVMAVHRVGELSGRLYLVHEYVRGQSLAELPLPQPPAAVRALALDLGRGLAAAHRHGVLHRDIKLANAILGEDGVTKLLDFGLAKLLDAPPSDAEVTHLGSPSFLEATSEGTLIGTPTYMAPELWRADPATRRSDVYALGVVLYSLSCGRPPNEAMTVPQLAELVQRDEPPPLRERAPAVDPAFAALVDRCLRRDPDERFASGDELRAALEALAPAERERSSATGNPYRGLRAFEAEHRDRFFGRTREVQAVVERLRGQPFVIVAGDSGVGKSSLCRAGVLPLLDDGALEPTRSWRSVVVTPGRHPVGAVVDGLTRALGQLLPDLRDLVDEGDALERVVRRTLRGERGVALFVDQLEELITLAAPVEAARAGRLLVRLADGIPGVRLLATVRADFLTRVAQVPELGDELARLLYFLRPLTADGVRQAVVGPAQAQGVGFESAALIDDLVTAGVEGSLPLLQFALAELWEARDSASAVITAAALERIGGVEGALARHADSTIARLTAPQRRAARALLLRLVTVDNTRASLTADELQLRDEAGRAALDALVAARLLVVRDTAAGSVHEVAHEALIRGWLTLQMWLEEAREARDARHRLETAAAEWDRLARPPDLLWHARQLADAAALEPDGLRPRELEFLGASRVRAARRRRLRVFAALAAPLLGLAVLLGIRFAREADRERHVDELRAAAAAAVAEADGEAATVAARRVAAFARFDARDPDAGEAAWREALTAERAAQRSYNRAARALEAALGLDPARPELRREFADVLLAQAALVERDPAQAEALATLLDRVALYDEGGERLARWNAPARLTVASSPPAARASLQAYVDGADGRRTLGPTRTLGATPLAAVELAPGSYLLHLAADGAAAVRVPVLLRRGESLAIEPELPPAAAVPAGFVAVPAGRFLYGAASDNDLRRGFLNAAPLHEVTTGPYLIARHETTYADWIAFLEALPADERAARMPGAGPGGFHQVADLSQLAPGAWQLRMAKGEQVFVARSGEPLVYPTRARRGAQDWLRMPVTGIDWEDAEAYLRWLDRTGRVPGARFCGELEWERAARGADGRPFPTGATIGPDDANFDETYGRDFAAMGPDAVGSHPASDSPFGLHDTMGNVFEWTTSAQVSGEKVARGGGFFFGALTGSLMNRALFSADFRDGSLGLRACADAAPRR
ncbi:MAG: SUMF1/EgtB/PvdO family nonheme iron enzyme [Myxococcales bacterium]|nr:SUMF1/EgtB/PvdO family nonheme iron enzyme [Myxococcales bacterium]